jgi:nitroreductase
MPGGACVDCFFRIQLERVINLAEECIPKKEDKMNVLKAVKSRRSVRKFKPESIPADKLGMIFEAARLAPSAGNCQPWRFVVVQKRSRKKAVAKAANDQEFISDAAVIVVAVCDPRASPGWCEKDTMIALEHIVLAATSMGYGSCWIGAFDEQAIKHLLNIPASMKVVAILPIGVPDEKPRARSRKDFSEIFFQEQWHN